MGDALWSLVVLLTTANFPDVMMPAYTASRLAVVYFATFEIVGNWFLLNMVLTPTLTLTLTLTLTQTLTLTLTLSLPLTLSLSLSLTLSLSLP